MFGEDADKGGGENLDCEEGLGGPGHPGFCWRCISWWVVLLLPFGRLDVEDEVMQKNRPIELLEESLQILRTGGATVLLQHWTGALPFAISLLLMMSDMHRSGGDSLLVRDSLICTGVFFWMSYWKSVASRTTFMILSPGVGRAAGWGRTAIAQAVLQTPKLFVLPLAVVSVLAWPAASVFFRTVALEERSVKNGLRLGFAAVGERYKENAVAFLAIAALTLISYLNVLVVLVSLPSLWRMLSGYESDWSRMDGATVLGLLTVAGVTTWLLIDPWIQTYSLLRVFYQNARADGRDLLRDIRRIAAVVLLFVCAVPLFAQTSGALNSSVERVSQGPDYGWLHPPAANKQQGFLVDVAQKVADGFTSAQNTVKSWWRAIRYWLRSRFDRGDNGDINNDERKVEAMQLRWTLGILVALVCAAVVALFLRGRKLRAVKSERAASFALAADVLNEEILPSDVSQEEWLRLAFEYLSKNETRLAARAFYLANLSYLGKQSLLALTLSKSNRLYERELARQPKAGTLHAAFVAANRLYERAWFGVRELGTDQMDSLKAAVEQLRA